MTREPYPFHHHRYSAADLRRMEEAGKAWDRKQAAQRRAERQWRAVACCAGALLAVGLFYGAAGDVLTLTQGFTA